MIKYLLLDSAALQGTLVTPVARWEKGGEGWILTGVAARERIPGEARGTVALGTVLSHFTHCIAGTGVGSNAGVDTGSVLTDLSVPALGVG